MSAPRIKAVIFDMDGLLLDTEGIYTQVTQLISDRYGGRAFDWHFKQNTIGLGAYDLASYIVRALELPISPEVEVMCTKAPLSCSLKWLAAARLMK